MGMGQAAGIGCSMFIDKKLSAIRELDGVLVRNRMIELGVGLDHAPGGTGRPSAISRVFRP